MVSVRRRGHKSHEKTAERRHLCRMDKGHAVQTVHVQHGAAAESAGDSDSKGSVHMIDIESTVFDYVATALREEYKGISVVSTSSDTPAKFPAVCLWEQDNSCYAPSQTAECRENHAQLMYQCEVYSNRQSGKKAQAREIAAFVDKKMQELGFIRTFGQPVPNVADMTIYRYTMRFSGIIGKDNIVYTS